MTIKNQTGLKHRVAVYVPSTVDVEKHVDTSAWVRRAAEGLSRLYGGCTIIDGQGCWMSDEKGLVCELVKICYAFSDDLQGVDGEKINQVLNFCEQMKKTLNQEAISLELDGELFFI